MVDLNEIELEEGRAWLEAILEVPDSMKNLTGKVQMAKATAVRDTISRMQYYRKHGIRPDLVRVIWHKRLDMIKNAKTIGELNEISKPPNPHYDGNKFVPGPYDIPEEEMVIWSFTSLRAPLNQAGFDRYMELFRQVFGVDVNDPDLQDKMAAVHLEVE